LGKFLISELTLERVKTWRNGLVTKPKHRRCGRFSKKATIPVDLNDKRTRDRRKDTANRILGTLKAALNFACQEDFSIIKVWTAVKPFENVGQPRVNYLEIPDQRRLLTAATGAIHDLIEAALLTGCRFGELSRLRVDDFDLTNGSLFVWETKSKKTRHIWLSEAGIELFKRVAANRDGTEPLLRQESGTAWKPSTYQRPFKAALVEAKVKVIAFHELRHSYATALLRNGAPPVVVAEALGHSDLRMVTKHYGHIPVSFASETIRRAAPDLRAAA
jgi:integrase